MKDINKHLSETFELVNDISSPQNFIAKVGRTKSHSFNGRTLSLSKVDIDYLFSITTLIPKGLQTDKELKVGRETGVQLVNDKYTLYTKGKYIVSKNTKYLDLEGSAPLKELSGEITSFSTQRFSFYTKERRYRIILPLTTKIRLQGDFTGWSFSVDGKPQSETLVKLFINQKQFHVFTSTSLYKQAYLIIDSLDKQVLEDFQKTTNSVLLAYAFLKGDYHGVQGYIFTYIGRDFRLPASMLSITLGGGIFNGFSVHSAKPHSLIPMRKKMRYKRNKDGKIIGIDDALLKKYMVGFPEESLSKICEMICNKGGILRAVILFVSNHSTTLEMKIPILFVALENITKVLIGGDKSVPKLIENNKIIGEIKKVIKSTVKEIGKIEKNNKQATFTVEELKDYKASFARITGKLDDFNKGTNNKKLIEPFIKFGYELSEEEKELIFVHRNKFLHGDDFMTLDTSYEFEFKELFHISMRLHKLIAVLLLKASDYSGYILNNAKLYDYISEKSLREEIFVKI